MFNLRFLNNLKQKLTTGNRGSIYLNALPERYLSRLDLEDLNTLRPHLAKDFIDLLTTKSAFQCSLSSNRIVEQESEKTALNTIFRRLTVLAIENNDHFAEQGVKTFGFGFPILLYKDPNDPKRVIKAPLFIWYLDIERNFKRANEWILTGKEDFPILNNPILSAFLRNNASVQLASLSDDLLADAILDKNEIADLTYQQFTQLYPHHSDDLKQKFRAALEQPIQKMPSRQQVEKMPLNEATVLWSGVFGLFKSQKESIINDLDYFMTNIESLQSKIEQREQSTQMMEHCLAAVDLDPSQQHLLHLLEKGNNLVIQGPPGTGKSQTLTGIISNVLANKGTCLVVCEKKTALEVVQQNLMDLGLGELTAIIEDVYRDRQEVVHSVRERAQKQHGNYKVYPSYLKLLKNCLAEIEHLQTLHKNQLQPLLEEHTWADLVNQFLDANELANKEALEIHLKLEDFNFDTNELEHVLDCFEQAQLLLTPLQTLQQPFNAIHSAHFQTANSETAKLAIQRTLTTALRATQQAKSTLLDSQEKYQQQLEEHYQTVYSKKLDQADILCQQITFLLQKNSNKQLKLVQSAQTLLQENIKHYKEALVAHFESLYSDKIKGIDQVATLIKGELYGAVDEALETIKEAKEDIMAALYAYERLLEQHFEDVYMQKMDWLDEMVKTIEAGLAESPFYFNKNKGLFRAILHGVGAKYKKLEQDKTAVLSRFTELQKLHKKHQYFKFTFLSTKDKKAFTFESLLSQLEAYREATDNWHLQQNTIIQKEVRELNSRYSLKAVPYKEEAQSINQHLSTFRTKILRNKLITLEFKYRSLRLRDRFDQLEEIEIGVQKIKNGIQAFVHKNEVNWATNTYEHGAKEIADGVTFRTAFEALDQTHRQNRYFEHEFIKLGRPSKLANYYVILEHLTTYRAKVEAWYPSRLPIIERYQSTFTKKGLYLPLAFEPQIETLEQKLDSLLKTYNQEQLFKLPFQIESHLYEEQLKEWQNLETQLDNWVANFENFQLEIKQEWRHYVDTNSIVEPIFTLEALGDAYSQFIAFHQTYNYFDFSFPVPQQTRNLLQQEVIKSIQQYRIWTHQWYHNRSEVIQHELQLLSPDHISPHVPLLADMPSIAQGLQQFAAEFNAFQHLEAKFSFTSLRFKDQEVQLGELEEELLVLQASFDNFDAYYNFRTYWQNLSKAQQASYEALAAVQPKNWAASFTSWYLYAFLLKHQALIPDQQQYTLHKNLLLEYSEELKKMLVAHSLRYWRAKQTEAIETFHQEKAPIKLHSLYNKRGHTGGRRTPLRKIISTDTNLFTSFFPVLLVSPSVCSAILPLEPDLFDVVIFDEASQLRLEDTFCALVRGRYKVVSGDSQQMPPSDYFLSNTVLVNDDLEEETEATPILVKESIDFLSHTESLLEYALAEGNYKESFLEVHYRSKHPYLIDFSNAAFYGNRLAPMPNQEAYAAINFFAVNGAYLNYTNPEEVEQIIDYIINIAKPYRGKSCPSVGIATFNIHQRNLILERIQERGVDNPKESAQLQKLFMNGLFVKNLENIQGDERDVLIISTTFGLREDGSFIQNFGPINRQKGYRLLNVIITRAKQKLAVFTSIPSKYYEQYRTAIQEKGNVGKAIFYAYLAYAKAVHENDEASRKAILQLLQEHCLHKKLNEQLYSSNENAFKERVANFLKAHFPNRVLVNYQYAGFNIPLLIKDEQGQPKWVFDFDTFHQYPSEEAYCWDLFRSHHLTEFGFIYHRIWSKDWWEDADAAKEQLIKWIKSPLEG